MTSHLEMFSSRRIILRCLDIDLWRHLWGSYVLNSVTSLGGGWARNSASSLSSERNVTRHIYPVCHGSLALVPGALLLQRVEVCPAQGHVGVVISSALGSGESWSILHRSRGPSGAWSWGFVVHSALGSGGLCPFYTGSCSFLHWVLGGHVHPTLAPEKCRVSFCTGFWGMMSILHCPRRESRSILHWVLGVGPSHTTS